MKTEIKIPDSFAIERLMEGECPKSWVIKALHTVRGRDTAPGVSLVAFLEDPDGLINELRITLGITGESDAPGIIEKRAASCRLAILWNEVEVVDSILLSFARASSAVSLLLNLVSTFSHLADRFEISSPNS